jgi:hypothetical protein
MHSEIVRRGKAARIQSVVPSPAGWSTFPRALLGLLLFGFTILAGEWLVHQTEYLIEYGPRFNQVMAATPHHLYMGPLGLLFLGAEAAFLSLGLIALCLYGLGHQKLLRRLPPRVRQRRTVPSQHLPWQTVLRTAAVMAAGQTAIYLIQENVEAAAMGRGWPALAVLVAPQHVTVLPLHLFMALCGSLVLWVLSALVQKARRTVQIAQTLVALLERPVSLSPPIRPTAGRLPNLRLCAGALCLRSPPLAA